MPNLFPRKLSLVIADDDGNGVDLGRLSSRFLITRSADSAFARIRLTVFNLSADTVGRLSSRRYTQIRIDAGYPERFGTIFAGQVNFVYSTWQGADKVVEVYGRDGAEAQQTARASHTFESGTSVRAMVRAIVAQMPKVTIGSIDAVPETPIVGARTMSSMAQDALYQLGLDYGFVWQIVNGAFQAQERRRSPGGPALVVSRDTGMIGSPIASSSGIEVTTLLDPGLVPGRRVDVRTAGSLVAATDVTLQSASDQLVIRGQQGGRFDIQRLQHVGESRGQLWYTKFFALPEGLINGS